MVVPYSFLSTFIRPIHSSSCLLILLRNDLCWDQTPAAHLYLFLRKVVLIKTLIAIGRQFLETRHDATRLAVEGRLIVADLVDNQPRHRGEIYARVGVKTGSNEQDLPWRRRIQQ
jgi:hypothetical protein